MARAVRGRPGSEGPGPLPTRSPAAAADCRAGCIYIFKKISFIHTESAVPRGPGAAGFLRRLRRVPLRGRSGRPGRSPACHLWAGSRRARGGGKEPAARAGRGARARLPLRPRYRAAVSAWQLARNRSRGACRRSGFRARRVQRREGRRAGRRPGAVPRLTPTPAGASPAAAAAGERWEATASPCRWIRSGKASERARLLPFLSFPVFTHHAADAAARGGEAPG